MEHRNERQVPKCLLNRLNRFKRSSGENCSGCDLPFEAGLVKGLEPVDSGGTTALTKIVVNSSNISKGKAPRAPGNVNKGKRKATVGPKGVFVKLLPTDKATTTGISGVTVGNIPGTA